MERGETDVLHFLFAKNEALIGRGIVRLRDISSGRRGSRCTTEQRKTQPAAATVLSAAGLSTVAAAALVVRFFLEACLTSRMVASSVLMNALPVASLRSAKEARKINLRVIK